MDEKQASDSITEDRQKMCRKCERAELRASVSELFIIFGVFTFCIMLLALIVDRRLQSVIGT